MKIDDQPGFGASKKSSISLNENTKTEYFKNKKLLESIDKKLVFNDELRASSLLDEKQIKE
jgi:hypothetical protein